MEIKKAVDEWIKIIGTDDNNLKNYIHYQNLEKMVGVDCWIWEILKQ